MDALKNAPVHAPRIGCYQLHLMLVTTICLRVGALGDFTFPSGRYIYTGSAMNGLAARVARHLRRDKKLHWHIDYLRQYAEVIQVELFPGAERKECRLNQEALSLPGARVVVPGFGSSDCRCTAHLIYLGP